MIFQVNFTQVNQISLGGVNLEDLLFVAIEIPELFFFQTQKIKVPPSTKDFEVKPKLNK